MKRRTFLKLFTTLVAAISINLQSCGDLNNIPGKDHGTGFNSGFDDGFMRSK